MTDFETFLEAVSSWTGDREGILGDRYLLVPPKEDFGYNSTPRNALTFANMGVDGVHYAILKIGGEVRNDSPVIQVSPMDSPAHTVLADSFANYLADGCAVPRGKIEDLLAAERAGKRKLVSFLRGPSWFPFSKSRFETRRLLGEERTRGLSRYLDLIEPKPSS